MKIVMMTNTYTPHVGGVARSVEAFTTEYRRRGHRVLVVAPEFDNMPEDEVDVVRIPAIQRFNGSDFSLALTAPGFLSDRVEAFDPDVFHSHHPFLIGATALRLAHRTETPIVFTHHTMYEQYTHYVPGETKALQRFIVNLSTSYANLCDRVIAPSASVAATLRDRKVSTPIEVIPTGVDLSLYARGSGPGFRAIMGIPEKAFVVGHLGRLAPEKNIEFLAEGVARFLTSRKNAHFLVVGQGPSQNALKSVFAEHGLSERIHFAGTVQHPLLASAYKAMDVFAFASKSETQGMVLTEAIAAGVPLVALDAPGVHEVVRPGENGVLVRDETAEAMAAALSEIARMNPTQQQRLRHGARQSAENFSMERCADKALALYAGLLETGFDIRPDEFSVWTDALRKIRTEWDLLSGVFEAAGAALNLGEREDQARR
ncbi:MAG: glycosyl transferase family 1 [Rhodospirillaceae bacterium]|nr:glycosyl transferase family 1 [Rhodospirillaceae bacterium]|tara:strand:+ start:559 stop:1848 length:1290 start_codon:yes stop_codon:yes gene_type:complete